MIRHKWNSVRIIYFEPDSPYVLFDASKIYFSNIGVISTQAFDNFFIYKLLGWFSKNPLNFYCNNTLQKGLLLVLLF